MFQSSWDVIIIISWTEKVETPKKKGRILNRHSIKNNTLVTYS